MGQHNMNKKNIYYTVGIVGTLAFCFFVWGLFLFMPNKRSVAVDLGSLHGTWLKSPRTLSDFSFKTTQNETFTPQNAKGHWTFVFFGYTHCPYLCPTTLKMLSTFYTKLEQDKITPLPQVLLVTLDPKRDSIHALKKYVHSFNPDFLAARGTSKTIQAFTKEMGIAYMRLQSPNADPNTYQIEHSGTVMLLNPEAQLAAFFTLPQDPLWIADDYERVLKS